MPKATKLQRNVNRAPHPAQQQQPTQMTATVAAKFAAQTSQPNSDRLAKESATKVLKYLDDYRSTADSRALREQGYEIDYDRLVGVGANSAVFLAHSVSAPPPPQDKSGRKPLYTPGYDLAVKVVAKKWARAKRPSKTRTGNLKLALALSQTKPDNNILKVLDVFKTPERIFIFMNYCAYGNVISFIRRNGQVPSRLAQRWSAQMAHALAFLHRFHVAHRNYKLENVLVDDGLNAKLSGFGLSKFCFDLQTKQPILSRTICGSEPYLAPEMLKDSASRLYDPKQSDVWAFGVGLFLCITRRYPFEAESLKALKQEQLARRYLERDTKRRLKPALRDLLDQIFSIEPGQRPTMQELCQQGGWLDGAESGASRRPQQTAELAQPHLAGLATDSRATESPESPSRIPSQSPLSPQPAKVPTRPRERRSQHQLRAIVPAPRPVRAEEPLKQLSPVRPVTVQSSDALPPVGSRAINIEHNDEE